MCSRYSFSDKLDELVRVLQVDTLPLKRCGHVAPLAGGPVVVQRLGETPRVEVMQWGLVPWWAQDASGAGSLTTAACETVAERPALRSAYSQRRCLIIADGYFHERQKQQESGPPWRFTLNGGGCLLMMGGIWESWRPMGARAPLCSYSILTTAANPSVAAYHDRMPVILEPETWATWLNPNTPAADLDGLLRPCRHDLIVTAAAEAAGDS